MSREQQKLQTSLKGEGIMNKSRWDGYNM